MTDMENEEAVKAAQAEAQAAKAEAERLKAEAETIRGEKEKVEGELKKLQSKDMNFKRLRDMTEAEKEQLTSKEMELQKRHEELEDSVKSHQKTVKDDWRNAAIERQAHGDPERAKAIAESLKELAGEETDRASIDARVAKAAKLSRKDETVDHVASAMTFNGSGPEKPDTKRFTDTEEGKATAKLLGVI